MREEQGSDGSERSELERLRAEVAGLRADLRRRGDVAAEPTARRPERRRWPTILATLLIVLACVLAPLALVAVWAKNQVTNTDRYVATVAPLASEPAIQNAVADKVTAEILTHIDVQGFTTQALNALAAQGLSPQLAAQLQALAVPIADGVESFVRSQVGKIVQTDTFANAWVQANRVAHDQLVKTLTGEGGETIVVEGDTVSVDLGQLIQTVKQRLVASGFTLAERIPQVDASYVLFQSEQIPRVQRALGLLTTLGNWLPVVVLALLTLGVYLVKDHRRALVGAGLGVAIGMVLLALALAVIRMLYLDAVPDEVLPSDAAAELYDTIVRFLRAGLRSVLVLGLVVAAGAFMTGPSVTAVRARRGLAGAIGWLRGIVERAGLRTGPVGAWVYANRRALRIAAVIVAGLTLVFWDLPTARVIIGLAVLLLAVLAVIQFLARPPERLDGSAASQT
jgi:hypothetical protein